VSDITDVTGAASPVPGSALAAQAAPPPPPEAAEVRPGQELDLDAVRAFLAREMPDVGGDLRVLQFPNGSANLTYLLQVGETKLVLRRPPHGRLAPGAHDMTREFKVLSRLWRSYPRAPRALALCEDKDVLGADFFVMEYRPGVVIWESLPEAMSTLADAGRRIGLAVVDALSDLHMVDPASCELGDLGRPDGFVSRQVRGWRQRWELVAPPDGVAAMSAAAEVLDRTQPRSAVASVLHNDFKVDNCQFSPDDPDRVVSVFDWDMATLGDPLVDLGTVLNYWPDPSDRPDDRGVYPEGLATLGLPTQAEVIEHYARRTGFDVSAARWYRAFACWKTAVVMQQLYDRYLRGETTDPRMATRGERVAELAARSLRLVRQVAA
jgi:aminoglycoside phosphotransferase (APT) family kinase protein